MDELFSKEVAILETESSKIPGVSVDTFISRQYKDREIGAHTLGYISEISQEQLPKYRKRDNFKGLHSPPDLLNCHTF